MLLRTSSAAASRHLCSASSSVSAFSHVRLLTTTSRQSQLRTLTSSSITAQHLTSSSLIKSSAASYRFLSTQSTSTPNVATQAADATATVAAIAASPVIATTPAAVATVTPAEKKVSMRERLMQWIGKHKHKLINREYGVRVLCNQRPWDQFICTFVDHSLLASSTSTVGLASCVTFGIYTLYSFHFSLIDFYLDYNELDAPYLSFFTGSVATVSCLLLYRLTRRMYLLNVRSMYRDVLKQVWNAQIVREKIGKDVKSRTVKRMQRFSPSSTSSSNAAVTSASSFDATTSSSSSTITSPSSSSSSSQSPRLPYHRLVSYLPSTLRYRPAASGWRRYITPRRLQLSFFVEGENGSGIVTCEVEQSLRADWNDVNMCKLMMLREGEEYVLISHTDTKKKVKNSLLEPNEEETGISRVRDLTETKVRKF